ncbi:F-box protein At1g67340-like [Tasmannia lanceolata]|uniref:F-box protein At1g67340-like n=1 Tax=Tasmannia lanceolata TaxID=3420 RepID=UPI0040633831
MRTRRGFSYPKIPLREGEMKRREFVGEENIGRKRTRTESETAGISDFFEELPDDLIVFILCKLSSTAGSPSDFINVLMTCKRLKGLGLHPIVLSKASPKSFAVKAKNWSESSHRCLKLFADAGNIEACYTLGMIRFYCLESRASGAALMARAAIGSHAAALYSLAVIQFNGSGGTKNDKNLRAGFALSARAAFLGNVDALRELGHCLQDGYGVRQNIAEGRRFLVQANARELASVLSTTGPLMTWHHPQPPLCHVSGTFCPLLSDFGCNLPAGEAHPASRFLAEWFGSRAGSDPGSGLRLCSHSGCGRPETRRHEFRRCSVCGAVNYCSRACQALDWKLRHKVECAPIEQWVDDADDADVDEDDVEDGMLSDVDEDDSVVQQLER